MLRAYGLVYALLRNHVPVYWIINPAKAAGGDDFSVTTVECAPGCENGGDDRAAELSWRTICGIDH